VDISGTDEQEFFEVKQKNNKVNIAVYRLKEKKERGKKIYNRSFDQNDTRFINLEGFGGNDVFFIEENISSKIRLKITGGEGKDSYDLRGEIKTLVYDSITDENEVVNKSRAKINFN
jgi:hypothetical protein